jgi:hypothetical protein
MKPYVKALILVAVLAFPLFSSGCVYVPGRPYHSAVWVPGHWDGPYGDVWIRGHWR